MELGLKHGLAVLVAGAYVGARQPLRSEFNPVDLYGHRPIFPQPEITLMFKQLLTQR